jgi:di/tricarboxylate transporter
MVPIVIGLIEAFGLPRTSQVGKAMLLLGGILPSVTGVGVLTGAAPNPVIVNFLTGAGQASIGYVQWLVYLFQRNCRSSASCRQPCRPRPRRTKRADSFLTS